jgi:phenylalanyl-tRNA synthetase alpha chain
MREELINIQNMAVGQIMEITSSKDLENIRIDYFGKKGKITEIIKNLKSLTDPDEKKEIGILVNQIKATLEKTIALKKKELESVTVESKWFDPTLPGKKQKLGSLHPTSIVINDMIEIFSHLGFSVMEGPEIETDVYNFEKLNVPKDHPARSLQDALYIEEPEILLRSQTSSVESRVLSELKPPFRVVVAGKCYRYENVNASNNCMFYQFQGVALQKGLSMADLKGTLYYFAKSLFGEERKLRFRCKYYPEVEPGVGLDIDCAFCNQKGCSVCKGRGWIEMLGAGMIHPNILKLNGINPKEISGFAFGMGLDRIVMDRFKINDVRSLYNGDIAYSK